MVNKNSSVTEVANRVVSDELLRQRFSALWRKCLVPAATFDADSVWTVLKARYSERHRHYHDKQHLARCLEQFDLAAAEVMHAHQVEMAIWFHDVINEPGPHNNEQLSANFFRGLVEGRMSQDLVEAVVELILATTHTGEPHNLDEQFIRDIDLASFGCPWDCYKRDADAVKAEFPGPDEEFYRAQEEFLMQLLKRPKIFFTDFFNARYERQARANIARTLALFRECGP